MGQHFHDAYLHPAGGQGFRHFQPDVTAAYDQRLFGLVAVNKGVDGFAVVQGTQFEHPLVVGAGNRRYHRPRSGGDHQPVVLNFQRAFVGMIINRQRFLARINRLYLVQHVNGNVALFDEILQRNRDQLLPVRDRSFHKIRQAAGAVRNRVVFLVNGDLRIGIVPPGATGSRHSGGVSSDNHNFHLLFLSF